RALGCGSATGGRDAIGGAEGIVEKQYPFIVLKKRPRIAYLYSPSFSRVFSSDPHRIVEVVNRLRHFGPVAPSQGSTGAGVEDQTNRARAGFMFARVRSQQVPVGTDVVCEQNRSGAALDGRND